jgi:hypothetical protein
MLLCRADPALAFAKPQARAKQFASGNMCPVRTPASRCVAIASLSTHFEASLSDFRQTNFSRSGRGTRAARPLMQSPFVCFGEWRKARFDDFALRSLFAERQSDFAISDSASLRRMRNFPRRSGSRCYLEWLRDPVRRRTGFVGRGAHLPTLAAWLRD